MWKQIEDSFKNIDKNNKPIERCLWCKYGKINFNERKIHCQKFDKLQDKDNTCNKWRYGF